MSFSTVPIIVAVAQKGKPSAAALVLWIFARYSSSMGKRKKQQPNIEVIWEYDEVPNAEERLRRVFRILLADNGDTSRDDSECSGQLRLY